MMNDLQRILKSGSKLFRKYLALKEEQRKEARQRMHQEPLSAGFGRTKVSSDSLVDVLQCNSVLGSLTALQKRYLESLAEGPRYFGTNAFLWKVADPVEFAFLIVSGTAKMGTTQTLRVNQGGRMNRRGSTGAIVGGMVVTPRVSEPRHSQIATASIDHDKLLQNVHPNSEYARLEVSLQLRLEEMEASIQALDSAEDFGQSIFYNRDDMGRAGRDRFANKVLARLYSRRAYTAGMVFSRGIFLSDTSRMVSGDLARIQKSANFRSSIGSILASGDHHCHTSNLIAGPDGCVVMIFPRSTLVPFLDSNPGVLLCLLGTQVVV